MTDETLRFAGANLSHPRLLSRRLELCSAWRGVRYTQAYARLHPQAGSQVEPIAGGYALYVTAGSPVNSARGLGHSGPVSSAQMQALEEFYLARGETPRLHFSPLAEPGLLELLGQRGYRASGFYSVLARIIPPEFAPAPLPDQLAVAPARPEEAELWLQTVAEGFEGQAAPSPAAFDILGPNFHAADSLPFFAWALDPAGERQPAGGGGLYLCPQERAVELGGASTLVRYRRRGVQAALIEARLAAARRAGCDLAVVLTEPGSASQRNLLRAGFWLAYTKVVFEKAKSSHN